MLSTSTGSSGRAFLMALSTSSPLRSGRLMSSNTMSQIWDLTRANASAPVAASPTMIDWADSARIRRNPARVMVWSSTISARVMSNRFAIAARALRDFELRRKFDEHAGPAARGLFESHVAAKRPCPLAHALNATGVRRHDLVRRQAGAVIADCDQNARAVGSQAHMDSGCVRMAPNVGQALLKNPKHRRLGVVPENYADRRRIDLAADPGMQLEFLQLPL